MSICTSVHQTFLNFTPSLPKPNPKTFKILTFATSPISINRLFLRPITVKTKSLSSSLSSSHESFEELPPKLQETIKFFQSIEDSKAKHEQLLLCGRKANLDPRYRTPENKVHGCVSQVWIRAYLETDSDIVVFEAHSESELTKGLAALLVKGLSGLAVEEILQISSDFILSMGFNLTPSRTTGFLNMFRFMQEKAERLYRIKMKKKAEQLQQKKKNDLGGENSVQYSNTGSESGT